jgi:Putative metal-binding motif
MRFRPVRILGFAIFVASSGCSDDAGKSPFVQGPGDGGTDDAPADAASSEDAEEAGLIGGPCLDDGQCDDGIACTSDTCDSNLARCRFTPDDAPCQNGTFCDGLELCDPRLGCRAGVPRSCDDGSSCTIDRCDEATRGCKHEPRDADGDGDPDVHCGGHDCDDADPAVSGIHKEICKNDKDDDCNGRIDEVGCVAPAHDSCLDPLIIAGSGTYTLDATAAAYDYTGSCALSDHSRGRDVVAAIDLAGPGARDVDVLAEAASGSLSVGLAARCDDPHSEIACMKGINEPNGTVAARIRGRGLGAGSYPLYVWTDLDQPVSLRVTETDPVPKPTNETCASAIPIVVGQKTIVSVVDAAKDLYTNCNTNGGELVYTFDLASPADVVVFSSSLDGRGAPCVSLRNASCQAPTDEISCHTGNDAELYVRGLGAGTYKLAISATAPTDVAVTVRASAPTEAPADETCAGAPVITPNRSVPVSLAGHTDDVHYGCAADGEVDAVYALELAEPSDVLLVERISGPDLGSISLGLPACAAPADVKACSTSYVSPVRASVHGVSAGSYRVVAETTKALPVELTALVRPASVPTLIPFADTCSAVATISPQGGIYQGNTANASGDYSAGCDTSGAENAPDQMLKLVLTSKKRVIFDMSGSSYATLLDVRSGAKCPGTEIPSGCSVGSAVLGSFVDRVLAAGTYWIQVDGFVGDSGAWMLDVHIVDP